MIDAQKALNVDNPQIIYGRLNANQLLRDHEIAMNAAALTLLENDPKLIRFEGATIRTGPLIDAAKSMVAASGFNYTKATGSRSAGLAGALGGGKRPLETKTKLSRQEAAKAKAPRKSPALRVLELEMLPRRILDLEEKILSQRQRKQQLSLRAQGDDLADAIKLADDISRTQLEVLRNCGTGSGSHCGTALWRTAAPPHMTMLLRPDLLYPCMLFYRLIVPLPIRRLTRRRCCSRTSHPRRSRPRRTRGSGLLARAAAH